MKKGRARRTSRGKSVAVLKLVFGAMALLTVAGLNMGVGCQQCSDTCLFAGDGECDDGGVGAITTVCPFGTDCADCGSRRTKLSDLLPADLENEQGGRAMINDLQPVSQDAEQGGRSEISNLPSVGRIGE